MSASRIRGVSVALLLLLNASVVLAWSQPWLNVDAEGSALAVAGSAAGGAELPLALTGLILVGALLVASPVFRVILSVLQALLGLCVAIAGGLVLADPASAGRAEVARTTGIDGSGAAAVTTPTAWPIVALILGILLVLAGSVTAATVRSWPRTTSRFERSRTAPAEPPNAPVGTDRSSEWDALSEGEDPTDPAG